MADIRRDMSPEEFRTWGYRLVDWIADYLDHPERYPVLARVKPGEIAAQLRAGSSTAPADLGELMQQFDRILVPGLTHWNHPSFFAYFSISASGPGILADLLSSALNQQAMLWRTSPAATELEAVSLDWLREMIGLPASFEGVIYDTASVSSLHALAAAREVAVPGVRQQGLAGRDLPRFRVYCSEHAHSSIDKGIILLGLGHDALRKIPADADFRMRVDALESAIREDRALGWHPMAVVATVGTTSTTSVDPVPAIAHLCQHEGLWLHVDAAYAGVAAMVPGWEGTLAGCEHADSLVVNPHKWLFTPFDLSAFYCQRMDVVRAAFSLVPEYLRTTDPAAVKNLMDTGVQLGRRFRALKLWMILRYFGRDGLAAILADHMRVARLFASWVEAHPDFEVLAPVPFSVVCFRAKPQGEARDERALEALNAALLEAVNATGELFISHTKLGDRYALRLAIGNIRTTEAHVARAWEVIQERLRARGSGLEAT
jgi:aromatic-L-amino-acid decarboxylase